MKIEYASRRCCGAAIGLWTVIVICAAPVAAKGAELGRLFTTLQERAALDKLRREGPKPVAAPEEIKPSVTPEPISDQPPQPITVNGFVKRSDGANTVWINGVNSLEGEFDSQGIQVDTRHIRSDRVTVTVSGRPVRSIEMRPGQTFDPAMGRMVDVYQVPQETSRIK
ncbi:MAG: hypothetical protein ACREV4_04740 [Gammaproteobacteria bacterium]